MIGGKIKISNSIFIKTGLIIRIILGQQLGTIDFVQKSKTRGKFIQSSFEFSPDDISALKELIKITYNQILNLEFNKLGEECQDRDHLHALFK
jgi:hypothetical protein